MVRRVFGWVGGAVVVSYLAVGLLLYAMQDRLLYPAPGGIDRDALDAAAAEVGAVPRDLRTSDGVRIYAWHLSAGHDRAVLFLPGNGESLMDDIALYRLLLRNGWDVVAPAYRGYPGSQDAPPSEEGLTADALAAWRFTVGPAGYRPERVVVHGRSLGGGVAAILVEGEANPAGLVLESTFTSVRALARRTAPLYPVRWLLRDTYDTLRRAPSLGVPVLVLHSRDDQLIPRELSALAVAPYIAEVEVHETLGLHHEDPLPVADPKLQQAYLAFLARAAG